MMLKTLGVLEKKAIVGPTGFIRITRWTSRKGSLDLFQSPIFSSQFGALTKDTAIRCFAAYYTVKKPTLGPKEGSIPLISNGYSS